MTILILLQLRGRMSAAELAAELEVSVRTIHRDIDQLSAAGTPVYAERGRDGGFRLPDGYRTRLTGLTAREAEVLLLAGLGAAAADLGVAPELAAAQLKLAASLPAELGTIAAETSQRFFFDPKDWYRPSEKVAILPMVAEAVWRGRRLAVRYESWERVVDRTLDPLGLVLKAGAWYVVAAVDGALRTYRVASIKDAEFVAGPVQRPRRFDLARYWAQSVAEFEASLMRETARLRLTRRGATLLASFNAAMADALAGLAPAEGDAWFEASVPIESVEHAATQMLRLGAEVEALGPPALRARLAAEGARLTATYG